MKNRILVTCSRPESIVLVVALVQSRTHTNDAPRDYAAEAIDSVCSVRSTRLRNPSIEPCAVCVCLGKKRFSRVIADFPVLVHERNDPMVRAARRHGLMSLFILSRPRMDRDIVNCKAFCGRCLLRVYDWCTSATASCWHVKYVLRVPLAV